MVGSAVDTAAATVREIRVAEVTRQDVTIENGQVTGYRVRLAISFKYESEDLSSGKRCAADAIPTHFQEGRIIAASRPGSPD